LKCRENNGYGVIDAHVAEMDNKIIEPRVPGICTVEMNAPLAALFVILRQNPASFLWGDLFAFGFLPDPMFQVRYNPDLQNVRNPLQIEMTGQAVIHHVALLDPFQKSSTEKSDIPLFAIGKAIQNRRGIMDRPHEPDFRDIELCRGFEDNFTREALIIQNTSQFFRYLFAPTVGSPANRND
jgi:hypothetical protein